MTIQHTYFWIRLNSLSLQNMKASEPALYCNSSWEWGRGEQHGGNGQFFWEYSHVQNILSIKADSENWKTGRQNIRRSKLLAQSSFPHIFCFLGQCLASSAYQFQHLYVGGKVPPLCTSSACFLNNVIIGKCFIKSRHETTLRRMCDWYYCFPETYICFI